MSSSNGNLRGRGASDNPKNRFELITIEREPDPDDDQLPVATQLYRERSRSILAKNDSPDVGFEVSINPYRGCEHGCVYCYARPTHEWLGWSAGLDFETKIVVKDNAPELLRKELASPRWRPQVIAFSGVTDCYQPIERQLKLTRRCLEVLAEFRNPFGIVTKSRLVCRDLDVLQEMARHNAAAVFISLTTLDDDLAARLEPRATRPAGRLAAIRMLADVGVPVGVLTAPVIPGLNDHELPALLQAAADAGAQFAGHVLVRLPYGLGPLFDEWLQRHYPAQREKVLGRIRETHQGKLNDPRFGAAWRVKDYLRNKSTICSSSAANEPGLSGGIRR